MLYDSLFGPCTWYNRDYTFTDVLHSFYSHKYVYIMQGTPAATNMSEKNFVTFSAALTEQEYLNFSVSLTNLKWSFLLYGIVQVHLTCSCV